MNVALPKTQFWQKELQNHWDWKGLVKIIQFDLFVQTGINKTTVCSSVWNYLQRWRLHKLLKQPMYDNSLILLLQPNRHNQHSTETSFTEKK